MNICIMGATSHIAKGLIENFLKYGKDYNLSLFSRSPEKVHQFLKTIGELENCQYKIYDNYESFDSLSFDVIINCVGVETRNKHNCDFTRYFSVTEKFDNLVIDYLKKKNPEGLYISFSSGAVYGHGFTNPVDEHSTNVIPVNQLTPERIYGIVRINAEAKHRAHKQLRIIDLRIFSYFSKYIILSDGYFITDVIEAIKENKLLVTDSNNIVRDYLHPEDLFNVILKCMKTSDINNSFDIQSVRPVSKQEILEYFSSQHGLKYETKTFTQNQSATGAKNNYYSIRNNASLIDFIPKYSSIETLITESKFLLP